MKLTNKIFFFKNLSILEMLPNEVYDKILRYLRSDDKKNMRMTSKRYVVFIIIKISVSIFYRLIYKLYSRYILGKIDFIEAIFLILSQYETLFMSNLHNLGFYATKNAFTDFYIRYKKLFHMIPSSFIIPYLNIYK